MAEVTASRDGRTLHAHDTGTGPLGPAPARAALLSTSVTAAVVPAALAPYDRLTAAGLAPYDRLTAAGPAPYDRLPAAGLDWFAGTAASGVGSLRAALFARCRAELRLFVARAPTPSNG